MRKKCQKENFFFKIPKIKGTPFFFFFLIKRSVQVCPTWCKNCRKEKRRETNNQINSQKCKRFTEQQQTKGVFIDLCAPKTHIKKKTNGKARAKYLAC